MAHNYIYSPPESSQLFIDYAKQIKSNPGVPFITPRMREYIIPARSPDVIAFIGRPGNGKSSLLSAFAKFEALQINARKEQAITKNATPANEAVLYVTWEQTIETQEAFAQAGKNFSISDIAWGRVETTDLVEANKRRLSLPIWIAGRSLQDAGKKIPPMYVDALFDNIMDTRNKFGVQLTAIMLDYLQLIPVKRGAERHLQVAEAILGASDLAKSVGCPVYLAVQAKDTVDSRQDKIPTMGDTFYTSELDHAASKAFGILKPAKYYPLGTHQTISGVDMTITPDTFIMRMFKQRGDQGSRRFPLYFEMQTLTLEDMDTGAI